ncbi:MAG: TSUP family transporter, partial [Planctomycetes bacterium]|nr:TSUP family transporter [Planctomycetota bacterium]
CKLDVRAAAGNAKMVNLASNLAAFVTFLFSGALFVQLGLVAGIFSVLGHYVGAGLAIKKGYRIVRPIVLTVLTLLFIRIVFFEIVAP